MGVGIKVARLWLGRGKSDDEEFTAEDTSINPQAAYFFKRKMETATLSLTEVDNPLGLTV